MYATHSRLDYNVKPAEFVETKHLVATFSPSVSVGSYTDEDSQGNRNTEHDTACWLVIKALCGAEFNTSEISMFGDAGLCWKCLEAHQKLPRYVR